MEDNSTQDVVHSNGKLLGRDEIFAKQDIIYEDVDVPEWGGTVRVKALTGAERDEYEGSLVIGIGKAAKADIRNMRAKLAARAMVDKDLNRLMSDKDVARLGQKSAAALDRVYEVATRLSKISQEDIEEMKGNSERGPSDDS